MEEPDPIKPSEIGPHSLMRPTDPLLVPWSHFLMKPIHPLDPIGPLDPIWPLDPIGPLDPLEPIEPLDAMLPRKYWIPFNQ